MSNNKQSEPIVDEKLENPNILRWAGGLLFGLGLVAAFLAFVQDDLEAKVRMVLNAVILVSLGYPMLLYVRALQKIMALEKRIREMEREVH